MTDKYEPAEGAINNRGYLIEVRKFCIDQAKTMRTDISTVKAAIQFEHFIMTGKLKEEEEVDGNTDEG